MPLPIARFNFIPNTVQSGLFVASILTFSSAGIDRVDWSISGKPAGTTRTGDQHQLGIDARKYEGPQIIVARVVGKDGSATEQQCVFRGTNEAAPVMIGSGVTKWGAITGVSGLVDATGVVTIQGQGKASSIDATDPASPLWRTSPTIRLRDVTLRGPIMFGAFPGSPTQIIYERVHFDQVMGGNAGLRYFVDCTASNVARAFVGSAQLIQDCYVDGVSDDVAQGAYCVDGLIVRNAVRVSETNGVHNDLVQWHEPDTTNRIVRGIVATDNIKCIGIGSGESCRNIAIIDCHIENIGSSPFSFGNRVDNLYVRGSTFNGGSSLWRCDRTDGKPNFVGTDVVIERSTFNGNPAPTYYMARGVKPPEAGVTVR